MMNRQDLQHRLARHGGPRLTMFVLAGLALVLTLYAVFMAAARSMDQDRTEQDLAAITPAVDRAGDGNEGEGEGQSPAQAHRDPTPMVKRAVDEVQQRNVFSPPSPTGFQGQLTGLFGDQAIFNGSQAVSVGGEVMGAKVTEIGPDWVRIQFEGESRRLSLFGEHGGGGGGPSSGGSSTARQHGGDSRGGADSGRRSRGGGGDGPQRAVGGGGRPDMKALRERWQQMSPEQREQARQRLRERFRNGGGGPRDGGGDDDNN